MGVAAWYYNEYFVEEPAHDWKLDLEESSSGTKRKERSQLLWYTIPKEKD